MQLNEKIISCRKKLGLSQNDLADLLDVSRQSVSKWETGESNPDLDKLKALAKAFDVSIDWLLDEEKDNEDKKVENKNNDYPEWLDKLPKNTIAMFKKYGWIYGVYSSIGGFIFIGFGILVRVMSTKFILGNSFHDDIGFGSQINSSSLEMFKIFSNIIIIVGAISAIFNLSLALILKIWGAKKEK